MSGETIPINGTHAPSDIESEAVRTIPDAVEAVKPASAAAAEPDDRWVIRKVPQAEREDALASAKRRRVTMGEWIASAIRRELAAEREEMSGQGRQGEVLPPRAEQLPAVPASGDGMHHLLTIEQIGRALDVACRVADVTQRPVSRKIVNHINRALLEQLDGRSRSS